MIAQASQVALGLTGFAIFFAALVLLILAILMPWYVYRIAREGQRTNRLLRQLIKVYGHEPEA